jgi:hypothetical protein
VRAAGDIDTGQPEHHLLNRFIDHFGQLLNEAAIAAEKNLKSLYNSRGGSMPGAIKPKGGIP